MRTSLTDGIVTLRQYRESDIQDLYEAARESWRETFPWLPWCKENYTIEESASWVNAREAAWNEEKEFSFVIEANESGKFLGTCGLEHVDAMHKYTSLGYWIRSGETGKGYATRAARLTVAFGLEDLGLNRIELKVARGNDGSKRVAEKIGAQLEGTMRKRLMINEKAFDTLLYSVIPDDL